MDLSSVTLAQLRYLVAVDRERSFRGAATQCHVSQPALSMQVRKLEDALGIKVFDRSRQPVVPTAAGEAILAQARRVLSEAEHMERVVRESEAGVLSGPYRLGVIPTLAPSLLPRLLPELARALPQVELRLEELQTDVMLDALLSDELDAGLAATPLSCPGVRETPLYREAMFAYLPRDHPLTAKKRVRQRDLASEDVWLLAEGHCFGDQVLQLCEAQRPVHKPGLASIDFRAGSFESLRGLVDAGLGVTVLPELEVMHLPASVSKAQVRPFALPEPTREVSFLAARQDLRGPIHAVLIDIAARAVPAAMRARLSRKSVQVVAPRIEV